MEDHGLYTQFLRLFIVYITVVSLLRSSRSCHVNRCIKHNFNKISIMQRIKTVLKVSIKNKTHSFGEAIWKVLRIVWGSHLKGTYGCMNKQGTPVLWRLWGIVHTRKSNARKLDLLFVHYLESWKHFTYNLPPENWQVKSNKPFIRVFIVHTFVNICTFLSFVLLCNFSIWSLVYNQCTFQLVISLLLKFLLHCIWKCETLLP